jgi:hypothetical protein
MTPPPLDENSFPLFAEIKNAFGFIPNLYRAQTARTDLIEAEDQLVGAIMIKEGALTRKQKEYNFRVLGGKSQRLLFGNAVRDRPYARD